MNVRQRFGEEVCPDCEAFGSCEQTIEKQAQCATLATYFLTKQIVKRKSE